MPRSIRRFVRRFARLFVVAEDSMRPFLEPGDGLVAIRCRRIGVGEIRIFEHPGRPDFWLVKRVGAVDTDRFIATSDNSSAGAVDSRQFGAVPITGSYRMLIRIPGSFIGDGRRSSPRRRVRRVARSRDHRRSD